MECHVFIKYKDIFIVTKLEFSVDQVPMASIFQLRAHFIACRAIDSIQHEMILKLLEQITLSRHFCSYRKGNYFCVLGAKFRYTHGEDFEMEK